MRLLLGCLLLTSLSCSGKSEAPPTVAEAGTEAAASPVETRVLEAVREMMRDGGGRVTFSDLYNDTRWGAEEKAFLGRLYETFFLIPGYLKTQHTLGERVPRRSQIGDNFGISKHSVELLLRVMESDPRMPRLFSRDSVTQEIASIELKAIDAFVTRRGQAVRVTSWQGEELPDFTLQRLDGAGSFSRSDLAGEGSLVYFWFSGCPPCVRLAPHLAELDGKYRARGFQTVGLNADAILNIPTTDKKRKAYLAKTGTTYPNLQLTREVQAAFGNVNVYPTIFISGPDLKISQHSINYQNLETLETAINNVLDD